MNNSITLQEAVNGILNSLGEKGYSELTLIKLKRVFNRLLKLAKQLGTEYLSDDLVAQFLANSNNSYSREYSHEKFLLHNRCIRFLESYLETGNVFIREYRKSVKETITDEFANALELYDLAEQASELSADSIINYRYPVRYLLEYMTSLGYQKLSDIQPGDTIKAIGDMMGKHYAPTSLVAVIPGLRRFYEMFPELQPFSLEIPDRVPRKRSIIDVYTDDENAKIASYLASADISRRDVAICLLSFETGLRDVDICNLRLGDVDWKHNVIHIVQSKTQKSLNLPLRSSYGNAMAEYLLNERPECNEDYFFLSVRVPHVKLTQIRHIIKAVVSAAGVEIENRVTGSRMFRHNAASAMLKKGVPLSAISEGLGHKSMNTTMIYLSTDQETMASLTLPLPKRGDKR